MKKHKFLFSLILLPVACILLLASCKEKNFDVRGIWIVKEPHLEYQSMNHKPPLKYLFFTGTTKIGEAFPIGKNFFSRFLKIYYHIEKSRIEITCMLDEYQKITYSGKFINENKMKGTWYFLADAFGDNSGGWEATRVINEK